MAPPCDAPASADAVDLGTEPAEADLNMELMKAADACDVDRVKELLASGAKASFIHDPPGTWGSCSTRGPLHAVLLARPRSPRDGGGAEAGEHGRRLGAWRGAVQALVEAKADVNAQQREYDWRGCGSTSTAFELALPFLMQDPELLKLFLANGADANAKQVRHIHSMRTDAKFSEHVLHKCVAGRNLEVARELLDNGADVNAIARKCANNERGHNQRKEETPLHRACDSSTPDLAMCALLIARGADLNVMREDLDQVASGVESPTDDPREDGFVSSVICVPVKETALHMAIRNRAQDLVVLLVCAGANASLQRCYGDVKTSCEDLCNGDEDLLKALSTEWSQDAHMLFPPAVQKSVEEVFRIRRSQNVT
ncbi:unnamed protein product [Prorocentrum cordatum]|uniref:Uncharacterized protein n=1 Tax=Prorocentrum cordatum TaxID=2364126 RepID=A0ABN9XE08_9DINO|nr:unnamed protein product [Polarella glacialis]|mmetsp:Transcript_33715/g.88322  ORF Transcript_33715/g.88322 Transcript_33715/m.88322 type:complete len:370 (-) Transcript_33715:145-1254(-)